MTAPLTCTWDGEAFRPLRRFAKMADHRFVIGEEYTLVEHQERSAKTHAHYFACVTEAWRNLPDQLAERFPTSEHLRRYALIKAGFADQRQLVASSHAEALRLASFVRPLDEYALVMVDARVVNVWTAKSQSVRAMDKAEFQDSKTKVLDVLAGLIGVAPAALAKHSEAA